MVGGGNKIQASGSDNNFGFNMYDGVGYTGSQRTAGAFANGGNTALAFPPFVLFEHQPTVGSTQVYSLGIFSSGGSVATWTMNATAPGYMIVEAY